MNKEYLLQKLIDQNIFWSYEEVQSIDDDNLIEYVLTYLDNTDIDFLFKLFKKNHIRCIWKERLVKQEPYYHNINLRIASQHFHIKDPEKYLKREAPKLYNF